MHSRIIIKKDVKKFSDGWHNVQIQSIRQITKKNGHAMVVVCFINKKNGEFQEFFSLSGYFQFRLFNLINCLFEYDPDDGEEFDLKDLEGEKIKIFIESRESNEKIYQNITDFAPWGR